MEQTKRTFFRTYAEWIVTHRLIVTTVILAVTALLVSRIGKLQMDTNPNLWAPQKHIYVETTNLLEEIFGGRNLTVIGIVPKSGDIYQPEGAAKTTRLQGQIHSART